MRIYRIDRLNVDGTRTRDIGRGELPDDKTTLGARHEPENLENVVRSVAGSQSG